MEYSCYKDAFDAVVKDNDGVLPDLYEIFDFIIDCRPAHLVGALTVAEIVAYAILEAAEDKVVIASLVTSTPQQLYVPVSASEPLYLDKLLDLHVLSVN